MVTKLGPLRRVKLLKAKGDTEKAGVGGSTPSLATIILKNLVGIALRTGPSPLSVSI